jgi:hypothetical protein
MGGRECPCLYPIRHKGASMLETYGITCSLECLARIYNFARCKEWLRGPMHGITEWKFGFVISCYVMSSRLGESIQAVKNSTTSAIVLWLRLSTWQDIPSLQAKFNQCCSLNWSFFIVCVAMARRSRHKVGLRSKIYICSQHFHCMYIMKVSLLDV